MALHRRDALALGSSAVLTALAGCSAGALTGDGADRKTYSLDVERIDASPVEHALYRPDPDSLFGESAETALAAVLPDGRHTTYGYEPLPTDAYVEHDGSYFQTKSVVTGRKRMARDLVRVTTVPKTDVPDGAVLVDSLDRASARAVKILHSHARSDGQSSSAELLRDDAYVLRRPAELEGDLATGELDGRVVTMTESGARAYRIGVSRERIAEPAVTTLAVQVVDDREAFREVVFASRIDVELASETLPTGARTVVEHAIARDVYEETTPLSEQFERALSALDLRSVDRFVNGRRLWYDGEYYRYALYVNDGS